MEMVFFKDTYQLQVISNAKAFAKALKEQGLQVEGDPSHDYTQTHQVLLRVDQFQGPAIAKRLEENNIIVNYQALPTDLSFSAASGLRLGVAEMTRFGMNAEHFKELAGYMAPIIKEGKNLGKEIAAFRKNFLTMPVKQSWIILIKEEVFCARSTASH